MVGEFIEGRTGRDRAGAAYDSIVGIDAEGGEESVHAAAQTTVKAVFPAKGLTGHAVKQEVPAQRPDIQLAVSQNSEDFSTIKVLHNGAELFFRQSFYGSQAPGQNFAVAPVRAKGEVVNGQVVGLTYISGLLSDTQMSRAGVIVGNALILTSGFDELDHGFKFPDIAHIPIDSDQILSGEVSDFVLNGFLVLIFQNVSKLNFAGCPHFSGVHK